LRILYNRCIEPIAHGEKPQNSETTCYIEAIGKTAAVRMYYPYVFEYAIKAGLIKDGRLVEPLIEPPTFGFDCRIQQGSNPEADRKKWDVTEN